MFTDNSYPSVLNYFQDKLGDYFSNREIKIFCQWAVASKFGVDKSDFIIGDIRFSESELLTLRSIVKELKTGKPIQYILNETEFFGQKFYVDEHVLIPRPETEELVQLMLDDQINGKVLDIGTGSAVIPIVLKLKNPSLNISAIDISKDALEVAKKNASTHKVDIHWIQADMLNSELDHPEQYDVIVSNPPYVLEKDKQNMSANVLDYEPHQALFVPDDNPLKFYKRIVQLSSELLKENGSLYFEIHEDFATDIEELLDQNNFQEISIHKDLQGKDRMIRAKKSPRIIRRDFKTKKGQQ